MKVTFLLGFLSASNWKVPVTRGKPLVAAIAVLIDSPDKSLEFLIAFSTTVTVSYPNAANTKGLELNLVL
mgnify:CR=1 FL=1